MGVPRLGPTLAAAGCTALLAACSPLPGEPAAANQPAAVVGDLAALLSTAEKLTYSAEYQLTGGAEAHIAQAQQPRRMALRFPGGMLTLTPAGLTDCTTRARRTACTRRAPARSTGLAGDVDQFADSRPRGIVPPETVVRLLTAAAADPDAVTRQYDTTIAGQHAGCVQVTRPAGAFDACVTTDGILGSFTGRVGGIEVDASLTRYRDIVDADAFDLPPGATVSRR
ncbi:hypothetical protein [Rhizomonospora bruguierae]|uniref:hypothetical protein n=1 Tax=Rhizomonospora bruguierae TaxID=1581705 RepID=UPI001BD0B84F|nr:hypothetical protein [Micromonospora sp. NBRC 107566]